MLSCCPWFWVNCSLQIPQKLQTSQRWKNIPSMGCKINVTKRMHCPQAICCFPSPGTSSHQQIARYCSHDPSALWKGSSSTELNMSCSNDSSWVASEVENLPVIKDTFLWLYPWLWICHSSTSNCLWHIESRSYGRYRTSSLQTCTKSPYMNQPLCCPSLCTHWLAK